MANARRSSIYISLSTFVSKGLSFIGSIFIARLLLPEAFGYVVIAELISALIVLFGSSGFENFYLQEKIDSADQEARILNVTYQLRLLTSFILFAVQIALSFWVEWFSHEPIVADILRVLALGHLINGIAVSRQYVLRKKLDFRMESIGNVLRDGIGTIFKVVFAYFGFGAVSIAMGAICGKLLRAVYIIRVCSFVPNIGIWDREMFKRVWHFGFHSFAGSVGLYLSNYVDRMILAASFSTTQIGYYSFGQSRAEMVRNYSAAPLSGLIIAWIASNKEKKNHVFRRIADFAYFETLILGTLILWLFIFAETVIPLVFGEHWRPSVPLFRVFLLAQLLSCLTSSLGNVLTGVGLPKLASKLVWYKLVLGLPALWFASRFEDLLLYSMVSAGVLGLFSIVKAYICILKLDQRATLFLKRMRASMITAWLLFCLLFFLFIQSAWNNDVAGAAVSFICTSLALLIANFDLAKKLYADES